MDASQYKDYMSAFLFVKYVTDKFKGEKYADIEIPEGGSFNDNDAKQIVQIFLQRIIQASSADSIASNSINPDLTEFTTDTIKSATIIVTVLPILCVYPFIQKYFVKGIILGAVKG